jgi:hypothetical protein
MILDIGPAAVEALADVLKTCRTLVWNGPLGAFETPPFDAATVALAKTAAALTKEGSLVSVAGGGDTVAALNHAGVADDFTFVSTAGGAFLEWMEGRLIIYLTRVRLPLQYLCQGTSNGKAGRVTRPRGRRDGFGRSAEPEGHRCTGSAPARIPAPGKGVRRGSQGEA